MLLTSLLLTTWVLYNSDQFEVLFNEPTIYDIIYSRAGLLVLLFFAGSITIYFFGKFEVIPITESYIKEYIRWFVTFFLTSVNHIYYKQVSVIYSCISKDIFIDNIIDNKFWVVKRI